MRKLILLFLNISQLIVYSQTPTLQWQHNFGGTYEEYCNSISRTNDGGFIVAGYSSSADGDIDDHHSCWYCGPDAWVIKLRSDGAVEWKKSYGGTGADYGNCIKQTSDGGFILAGTTTSTNGDITINHGYGDFWILKLSSLGVIEWQKTYGGPALEGAYFIEQTSDGGYIAAGEANGNGGDVTGNKNACNYWVIRLDPNGSLLWQKSYGGTTGDRAQVVRQTQDGGYVVGGTTFSTDGDVVGSHNTNGDYWIIKLNQQGDLIWSKCYGGTAYRDELSALEVTYDGGFIIGGQSNSNDGDVTGNHGSSDYWIVKANNLGEIQWQKCFGGSDEEYTGFVSATSDSGYIIAGSSRSTDGQVQGTDWYHDVWIVKIDAMGELIWEKTFGGNTGYDYAKGVTETFDGGYAFCGSSNSNNGDLTGNNGMYDYWIAKISGVSTNFHQLNDPDKNYLISIYPNPTSNSVTLSYGDAGPILISLKNSQGHTLKEFEMNEKTNLDFTNLSRGFYFIEATSHSFHSVQKIVVR